MKIWNKRIKCSSCENKMSIKIDDVKYHDSFCHNCAFRYVVCPNCGHQNLLSNRQDASLYQYMKENNIVRTITP